MSGHLSRRRHSLLLLAAGFLPQPITLGMGSASTPSSSCHIPSSTVSSSNLRSATASAACQQRYRCHLEKNATQMAAISRHLTALSLEVSVPKQPPRPLKLFHQSSRLPLCLAALGFSSVWTSSRPASVPGYSYWYRTGRVVLGYVPLPRLGT